MAPERGCSRLRVTHSKCPGRVQHWVPAAGAPAAPSEPLAASAPPPAAQPAALQPPCPQPPVPPPGVPASAPCPHWQASGWRGQEAEVRGSPRTWEEYSVWLCAEAPSADAGNASDHVLAGRCPKCCLPMWPPPDLTSPGSEPRPSAGTGGPVTQGGGVCTRIQGDTSRGRSLDPTPSAVTFPFPSGKKNDLN